MLKTAQQNVLITEVGPRDGLQNEVLNLCTLDKIKLIRKLAAAGIRQMEVTSFVSPKAVPNLADAEAVMDAFFHQHQVLIYDELQQHILLQNLQHVLLRVRNSSVE